MEKLKCQTPDFTSENIQKLAALFPNCVVESKDAQGNLTKAIDFDQLRQELSTSLVEGPRERYHLDWPGKRKALLAANAPIAKMLRPCRDESVDFDNTKNLFIEGDNLDALKLLQETFLGKVKLIYIDPPYNTGNDFIYKDDFAETASAFLERSNQRQEDGSRLVANTETNGRFHSDWLSMIYSRLKLSRNLLADNGLIFISIDNKELNGLLTICNEVFGADNLLEIFIWDKKNSAKGVPPRNMVVNIHEYIVCYSKTHDAKLFGETRTEDTFSNPDADPRGLWRRSNIKSTLERPKDRFTIVDPKTKNEFTNYWAFSQSSLLAMIDDGRIIFPESKDGLPKQKEFLSEFSNPTIPIKSQLGLFHSQETSEKEVDKIIEGKFFLYKKPLNLIKKIVEQGGNDAGCIVLDFFAGSSTTAHAVMSLNAEDGKNRRFIMVQIPEPCDESSEAFKARYTNIAEIGKERIRRAGKCIEKGKNHEQWNGDIGFRVLKVDTASMKDVFYAPDAVKQSDLVAHADNIKEDRTLEDLLFQVLVDWGVDLALPISIETIAGKTVFLVDGNALAACFDASISEELVKELAKRKPLRAVFRDSSYGSDSVKINVEQIFKLLSPATEIKSL